MHSYLYIQFATCPRPSPSFTEDNVADLVSLKKGLARVRQRTLLSDRRSYIFRALRAGVNFGVYSIQVQLLVAGEIQYLRIGD